MDDEVSWVKSVHAALSKRVTAEAGSSTRVSISKTKGLVSCHMIGDFYGCCIFVFLKTMVKSEKPI